jgi:glycosyltransferase involved in cell wall biosynthesis
VDDASPDDSVTIIERTLQEYPQRQGQVKILHHAHNMDISQTRKDGLNAATGEYFIYVDGDDWVELNYAELLYNKAHETGADIVLCDFYMNKKNEVSIAKGWPNGEDGNTERLRDDTLNRYSLPNLTIRLMRRSLFAENDIIWPTHGMAEDVVIITQLTYYAKKLAYIGVPLYHYRYNPISYSKAKSEEMIDKRTSGFIENYKIIQKFMRREGIAEKYAFGLIYPKIEIRNYFLPLINKPKYWWKHISTYPEINLIYLFPNRYYNPPFRKRLRMLATLLGLYPLLSRLTGEKGLES